MAGSVACASCGKEYRWKPEFAGKRAKCKCGGVVSFPKADPVAPPPPPPPPPSDVPEGFEDFGIAEDAPPPPPPPIPGRRPAAAAPAAAGGFKDSTAKSSSRGGFHWNWRAALNVLVGLGIVAFGIFEFLSISQTEAAGDEVVFGRRNRWLRTVYAIGGKWAVLAFFVIVGICFIGGAILKMMGKIGHSDSEH
jgi:hypothetical protein